MPKSNYQNGHEHVQKLSQSTKSKNPREPVQGMGMHLNSNQSKNINLPKLDKIIVRNNPSNYRNPPIYQEKGYDRKQVELDVSNLLKIEGRSSNKYDNKYD